MADIAAWARKWCFPGGGGSSLYYLWWRLCRPTLRRLCLLCSPLFVDSTEALLVSFCFTVEIPWQCFCLFELGLPRFQFSSCGGRIKVLSYLILYFQRIPSPTSSFLHMMQVSDNCTTVSVHWSKQNYKGKHTFAKFTLHPKMCNPISCDRVVTWRG